MRAGIDWTAAKTAYVTGNISYKALAAQMGATEAAVGKRANLEKWTEERRKYRARVQKRAMSQAEKVDAKRLAGLRKGASDMCRQLEKLMKDAQTQLYTHVYVAGTGDGCSEIQAEKLDVVDDRKLLNIARTMESMSKTMRNVYDIQTAAERQQMQLAREEMELKRRAQEVKEAENQTVEGIDITMGSAALEDYVK